MFNVRCPACQTVFRANPQQLGAYGGRVRCGRCQHVFNARDHIEGTAGTHDAPSQNTPSSGLSHPSADAHVHQDDNKTAHAKVSDAPSSLDDLDFVIPEPRESKPARHDEIELDWGYTESTPPSPASSPDRSPPTVPLRHDSPMRASDTTESDDAHFDRHEPRISEPPEHADADTPRHQSVYTYDDDEPERFKHYDQSESTGSLWLWAVLIGLMLGALAVQSAYLFRLEISNRWPESRPWFELACGQLGCDMPLATDIKMIRIATSDLESEPKQAGRYVLHADIRNDARHAQAYPYLELTLTDNRSRPIARRVLTPEEWLQDAEISQGFTANSAVTLRLPFSAPEALNAAGYRLYAFYP